MMERCPVCRARISTERCGRCKSEIGELLHIEEQASRLMQGAVQALAAGELENARKLCNRSMGLKKTVFGKVLEGFLLSHQCDN